MPHRLRRRRSTRARSKRSSCRPCGAIRPQLILVSAGFDAHFADDIAGEQLSVDGYGALVSMITAAAEELCGGRVVVALEGGYHLVALPWCVRRTIELLRGDAPTPDPLGAIDVARPAGFDDMLARGEAAARPLSRSRATLIPAIPLPVHSML